MAELIAHRGVPRERRENTVASFARALDYGATGIELDVHGTRDGVLVVHHDATLRASPATPSSDRAAIDSLTHAELRERDASALDPIPTLDEVLTLAAARAIAYIEIKAPRVERLVIDAVRRSSATCVVHSFDHRAVRAIRSMAPEIRTGALLSSYLLDPVGAMRDAGASDLWQQWELIDAELVEAIHGADMRIIAWTVNDEREAGRLVDLGVDGICTDRCGELREVVRGAR